MHASSENELLLLANVCQVGLASNGSLVILANQLA